MRKAEKVLVYSAKGVNFMIGPGREIYLQFAGLAEEAGLTPGMDVVIRMTAAEARHVADVLKRKADEAETGLPRA
ncbi:MAG TPA: hypothetical protein PKV94_07750 [Syntrophales bacterium]|nr:hypothetical protein [Syntrophales bacterium]HPN24883.1 hypothetical protein [Syntrophales bacterium]